MSKRDYYEILEVQRNSNGDEIKKRLASVEQRRLEKHKEETQPGPRFQTCWQSVYNKHLRLLPEKNKATAEKVSQPANLQTLKPHGMSGR